jgi:uncharacterized membrane protein YphA (DoxX/SURF4 family)
MEILSIIGQIIFGGFFIYNGINHFTSLNGLTGYAASKKVPSPKLAVIGGGIMLLLGGLGILLGMYTDIALWLIIIFLMEMTHFMKNLALIGAALMLL